MAVTVPLIVGVAILTADLTSAVIVALTIPLIPVFMVLIGLATRSVQSAQWKTLGRLAARFADTVQGLSTLKVFGRQYRAVASIEKVTDAYRRETMRVLRVSFLSGFALELLASISVAIVAVLVNAFTAAMDEGAFPTTLSRLLSPTASEKEAFAPAAGKPAECVG